MTELGLKQSNVTIFGGCSSQEMSDAHKYNFVCGGLKRPRSALQGRCMPSLERLPGEHVEEASQMTKDGKTNLVIFSRLPCCGERC